MCTFALLLRCVYDHIPPGVSKAQELHSKEDASPERGGQIEVSCADIGLCDNVVRLTLLGALKICSPWRGAVV